MSDNNVYSRICSLLNNINPSMANSTEIKALANAVAVGSNIVNDKLQDIFNQIFIDTMGQCGIEKYCALFGLKEYDKEKLKSLFAKSCENYVYGNYSNLYSKEYVPTGSCKCEKFLTKITLGNKSFEYLKKAVEYLNKYLCPGVTVKLIGENYTFDNFDSFDFIADEWDFLASVSFSFIDSLGGV